jgi:hypothetical protein
MATTTLSPRRALATIVVLPALCFLAIAFIFPMSGAGFSNEHKAAIAEIAQSVCPVLGITPCTIQWSGKNKWFGSISGPSRISPVTQEQIRRALPTPEWTIVEVRGESTLTNGRYLIELAPQGGNIVITSKD